MAEVLLTVVGTPHRHRRATRQFHFVNLARNSSRPIKQGLTSDFAHRVPLEYRLLRSRVCPLRFHAVGSQAILRTDDAALGRTMISASPFQPLRAKRGRLLTGSPSLYPHSDERGSRVSLLPGPNQFAAAGGHGVEGQLLLAALLADPDGDGVLAHEGAAQQVLGQRVLEVLLDGPAQRPGTELQCCCPSRSGTPWPRRSGPASGSSPSAAWRPSPARCR